MEPIDYLEYTVERHIAASQRAELVSLAIENLVNTDRLAYIGEGLYAKVRKNRITEK